MVVLAKASNVNIFVLCGDEYKVTWVVISVNLVQKNCYDMFQKPYHQDFLYQKCLKHNQQKFFSADRIT